MRKRKENPISIQSKQWLLDALLTLMEEKDFQSITITELTERACLDRKTFYRNFRSKEDVLFLKFQELCQLYISELHSLSQLSAYAVSKAYFDICISNFHFFALLNRHKLLPLALLKFDEYLPILNEIFLSNPAYRHKSKYELVYQAGGFWNITIWWLNGGGKETAEEMAEIISTVMPSHLNG